MYDGYVNRKLRCMKCAAAARLLSMVTLFRKSGLALRAIFAKWLMPTSMRNVMAKQIGTLSQASTDSG